jgi:uncharacterized membrane protein YbhN (UPF0104 family)
MLQRSNARLVAMAVALVVVAGCLFYLFARFDWHEPLRVVREANLPLLVVALVCLQFAYICVRTLRWQVVVRDRNPDATFGALYWITAIVVSLSMLTPGQIGETVKVEMLKRRGFGNRLPALGSFATERVLDLLTIAGFGLVGLVLDSSLAARFPQLRVVAAVLFVAALAVLAWLSRPHAGAASAGWIGHLRSGTGTAAVKWKMLALTIASWWLVGLAWQIALGMVGVHVSLPAVCWLLSIVTFGSLISLMPGGIGLADVVLIQALIAMGTSSTAAQAGALILRLHMLIGILFGCAHLLAWPFVPRSLRGQQS